MTVVHPVHGRDSGRRAGFTLIELIVVLLIILVLVSLVASAVFQVINTQRKSNTEQTIQQVSTALKQQWGVVLKQADNEAIPQSVMNMAAGDSFGAARARVIWKKLRVKQEFPATYNDGRVPYLNNDGITVNGFNISATDLPGKYATALTSAGPSTGSQAESSVCLVLALSRNRGGVTFKPEVLGPGVMVDPNNNNLPLINDAWGNPIAFNRFPKSTDPYYTELDQSCPGGTALTNRDPLDPNGYLTMASWATGNPQGPVEFAKICHSVNVGASYYQVPVLVSAGLDKTFGTPDDILSFRMRIGARGD
jgi:prepilin-type N-terminal cleavage/methylation domain-containing protein